MYKVIAVAATAAACLAAGSAIAQTEVERGKYLVESIMGCGNCHTPVGPNGPILDKALSGGPPIGEGNAFTAIPSNITPDPGTGIGKWTDAEIKTAIRQGRRPLNSQNGSTLIGPPMPFGQYRAIADADIDAVVSYLRTVPAVRNAVAKSTYNIPLPPAWGPPIDKPITAPPSSDEVAYGAYLAGPLGHCVECHTPMGPDHRQQFATLRGAGGMQFNGPWGLSVAKYITSDPEQGLGKWTDTEIERAIRSGIDKDGHALKPPMGYGYYSKISADDMAALIAWLRSLPAKKTP
ncbi:MAG TPA: c-type cytochrome [Reyranella sp.]|nr:c-type cytochrome [Reyranella sp.]